jgi:hypothetical protein
MQISSLATVGVSALCVSVVLALVITANNNDNTYELVPFDSNGKDVSLISKGIFRNLLEVL